MDTVYSLTLLAALIAGVFSVLLFGFAMLTDPPRRWMAWAVLGSGELALLFGIASAIVHATFGHGANSPEPMAAGEFLLQHKAYWIVVLLTILSNVGWVVAIKRASA